MNKRNHIEGTIIKTEERVFHGKPKFKKKKAKEYIINSTGIDIPDIEREKSCLHAGKTAHTISANLKRDISNKVRKDLEMY